MKRYLSILIMLVAAVMTVSIAESHALSLEQAKVQGLVGERLDGYLGAVSKTPEVEQLVQEINAKREAAYQEIAKKNGTSLQTVEALAAQKAINNTPPGQYTQLPDKTWHKK